MLEKEFTKKIDELIFYLDDVAGNKLYRELRKDNNLLHLLEQDDEKRVALIALQFLIIPFLETKEVAELLKENLYVGFQIEDIDLIERINKKLLFLDLSDRDNCKLELKKALADSHEKIIDEVTGESDKKIITIGDWIRDYVGQTAQTRSDALLQANYLYLKTYIIKLGDKEKNFLKKLFTLYRFLDISSTTPEGFEDDFLLETIDGKLITTDKGKVVVLYDPNKKLTTNTIIKKTAAGLGIINNERKINKPEITVRKDEEGEKRIRDLKILVAQYKEDSLERQAIEEEIKKIELEEKLEEEYPVNSLQHKAIEDEIRKLEK